MSKVARETCPSIGVYKVPLHRNQRRLRNLHPTGELRKPCIPYFVSPCLYTRLGEASLTLIQLFRYMLLQDAVVGRGVVLPLERSAAVHAAPVVDGPLQDVALPAENVVGVVPEPGAVSLGPDVRLAAVLGPLVLVAEARCIPVNLVAAHVSLQIVEIGVLCEKHSRGAPDAPLA